ncbi:MAG: hypothetical protein ABI356_09800 [Steroidobacteraceae bacterium]
MIKLLEGLLCKTLREQTVKPKPMPPRKRQNSSGDFRAVEIAPSTTRCAAAMRVMGKSYLLRAAPRLPLLGCTMPLQCSCKFRKSADRREGDRRLFGATETKRWHGGLDNRKYGSRRAP